MRSIETPVTSRSNETSLENNVATSMQRLSSLILQAVNSETTGILTGLLFRSIHLVSNTGGMANSKLFEKALQQLENRLGDNQAMNTLQVNETEFDSKPKSESQIFSSCQKLRLDC